MEPDLINECSELFDKIAEEIESRQRCLDQAKDWKKEKVWKKKL